MSTVAIAGGHGKIAQILGRLLAERTARMMGEPIPEAAFGWRKLAVGERSTAR